MKECKPWFALFLRGEKMKKSIIFISLISVMQLSYAAKPATPWLITPQNAATLPTNLPAFLSWDNLKDTSIRSYRVIVSTTPTFSGYSAKAQTCSNKTTCFMTTTKNKNYLLRKGTFLKNDNNYYWRVEAINREGASASDLRAFAYGSPTTAIDPKYTVVTPGIIRVATDLVSVERGKPLIFSATLDAPLPASNFVKVNYGNGFLTMNGTATDFTLSVTPAKSATYSIGIYDARNNLKSNLLTGKFTVTEAVSENVAPVLTLISRVDSIANSTVNTTYAVQLSATDVDGNLKQIFVDWGDGSSDLVDVEEGKTLAISHAYTTAGSFTWKASADDYADAISNEISQAVTVAEPVVVTPPTTDPATPTTPPEPPKPPRYSAIDSTGAVATSSRDWKCTRDDETGLIWELKTNDQGLHSKKWTYSWYDPKPETNGGYAGVANRGTCRGSAKCNTAAFIDAVNVEKLCGGDNWRLPTKAELEALVTCSDEQSTKLGENEQGTICTGKPTAPTIDTTYFPNTNGNWFWTSDTVIDFSMAKTEDTEEKKRIPAVTETSAWNVIFYHGYSRADNKGNAANVRLVREEAAAPVTP